MLEHKGQVALLKWVRSYPLSMMLLPTPRSRCLTLASGKVVAAVHGEAAKTEKKMVNRKMSTEKGKTSKSGRERLIKEN